MQAALLIRCLVACMFSLMLAISACSSVPAPVDARHQPPSEKIHTHTVGKGETLFSIAWSYGLDYRELARINQLDSNFTIHPGDVLKLDVGVPASATASQTKTVSKPGKSRPATNTPAKTTGSKINTRPGNSVGGSLPAGGNVRWQWPAQGKVIATFSEAGAVNKGIDIGGKLGEAVQAAAAGKVVYAGSGLLGYGQLIIIKHNEEFLSAYAHNRTLLVKEGDSVKAGDKIAEIGASGAEKVKLHFEIRRNGKPVDPEDYLPRRHG